MTWFILFILAAVVGSALLIKRLVPETSLDSWVKVATIVGAVTAAFSLLWGAFTYFKSERVQREMTAYAIYEESMKLSIEHPDFANPLLAPKPPGSDTSVEEKKRYEQYRWYVGQALYGFEQILEVLPDDEAWKKTAGKFIHDHQSYVRDSLPCERNSDAIRDIIRDSLGCIQCILKK